MKRIMNRVGVVGSVAVLALSMVACNGGSGNKPDSQNPAQVGPDWIVSVKTVCADGSTDSCQGYHGLSVDSDGNLIVGIDSSSKKTYPLGADERAQVNAAVKPMTDALHANTADHQSVEARDASAAALDQTDTISLTYQNVAHEVVSNQNDGLHYHFITDAKQAHALQDAMMALLAAHYPATFPDKCQDAIDNYNLNVLPQYTSCSTAADCEYVAGSDTDASFRPVPAGIDEYVPEVDDTVLNRPAVANAKALGDGSALTAAEQAVWAACPAQDNRFNTGIYKGFNTGTTAPACVQSRCQKSPDVH